ncbi:MAG: ABC transporter substrate-binding protein [Chitinophagaceae bacterium]|nr:ABC transporter substrate-binding protein [Oligoflexus sp.]
MRHLTFQRAFGLPSQESLRALAIAFLSLGSFGHQLSAATRHSINIAFEDNVRSFDPRQSVDANSQYIEDLVHCSLMAFDTDGKAIPGALEANPTWISPKVLEVQLRKDLKFSDGTTVRAEDVVATYNSLIHDRKFPRSSAFDGVERVEILGSAANRIRFTLKKSDASFPTNLVVGILKESDVAAKSIDPAALKGCGPYQIASTGINEIVLTPNTFAPSPGKLETVTIKIVRNEKTRYAKLRAGELDIVQNGISRDTLRTLERRNPNLKILKRPSLKTTYVGFNMKDTLVSNPAIREAISLAINRQEIINVILNGMAIPASTILPPNSAYFSEKLPKETYDPALAQALLDKAGFVKKGDFRFEVSLKTTTDVTRISVAKAIASQLKRVGIKVIVEPMEWGRFKLDIDQGRVQLWTLTWVGFKDPDIYRYAFATENFPPNGANRGWYSNPALDILLEQGREKNDFSERKKIYDQIQELVAHDRPYIFLWHEENFAVVTKALLDFDLYADGRYSSLQKSHFE